MVIEYLTLPCPRVNLNRVQACGFRGED